MLLSGHLLLFLVAICAPINSEFPFHCPWCTTERLAACSSSHPPCMELVRTPGCGCCPVCAQLEGETCGVYTARCSSGLSCYPNPGSDHPLQALIEGKGTCAKRRDAEYGSSQEHWADAPEDRPDNMLVENNLDAGPVVTNDNLPRKPPRSPMKDIALTREKANEQHRSKTNKVHEEKKNTRPSVPRSLCQQQLDQVLERISSMNLPDERGPLEHLYALHIPNCDKHGLFNLKQLSTIIRAVESNLEQLTELLTEEEQEVRNSDKEKKHLEGKWKEKCKMSVNGQRGECWCVNPQNGKPITGAPTVRGDPECHLYYPGNEEERKQRAQ